MKNNLIRTIGLSLAAAAAAQAGEVVMPQPMPEPAPAGDWCDTLKSIGTLYKDKENPYIQEVKVFGRLQYQWGYTDGELNGVDFDGNGDDLRRLRFGASAKFLNGFSIKAQVNLQDGTRFRHPDVGYNDFDELTLKYSFGEVAGFDDLYISYGRHKHNFTAEAHTSSNSIKTIERSNVSNFYYNSARPTSVLVGAKTSGVEFVLGLYDTEDNDSIGSWDGGNAFYVSAEFEAGPGDILLDYLYVDADKAEDEIFGYDWAFSAAYTTKFDRFELMLNGIYGENHDGDAIYGLVIMPSTYLIEDKLEAVVRYQYFGSDGELVRPNSRNVRRVAGSEGLSVGKGDSNHTLYGGLNYYLCGNNMKVMTGVEYETLDGADVELDAWTFWAAFRMYF